MSKFQVPQTSIYLQLVAFLKLSENKVVIISNTTTLAN